ncbi:DUF2314 domain-containing protein [Chryseobacterium sp.]|uniref:DUF2314 domain-containing protein n=1 Tax=Chryseobacterium sp. TaxID=1871047 RepID=UPI00388FFB14
MFIVKKKDVLAGIVNSNPMYTKLVKYDEIVEFKLDEVEDWMYFKGKPTDRRIHNTCF